MEEYEENMRITTEKEKNKLYSSDAYKRALSEKGRLPENWNWQTKQLKQAKGRGKFSTALVVSPRSPAI